MTINGLETIWLLADRRLTSNGHIIKDDARKIMFLDTKDGVAILGYAGLGSTAIGTEPSDWMKAVLRGINLPLEQTLGILAEATKEQLPRQLLKFPRDTIPAHYLVITAFVENKPRLYTIDIVFSPDRKKYDFRYTRHLSKPLNRTNGITPRICLTGSGGEFLSTTTLKWKRELLDLIKVYEKGKIPDFLVADYLSDINNRVHLGIKDGSVGPRCIVAWRNRKNGIQNGGGNHLFYTGTIRDTNSPSLPIIGNGMDIEAICNVMLKFMPQIDDIQNNDEMEIKLDRDEINAKLAELPDKPDNLLR